MSKKIVNSKELIAAILFIFCARYFFNLLMFFDPFIGILAASTADFLDMFTFTVLGFKLDARTYQTYDKISDDVMISIAFATLFIHPIIPGSYLTFGIILFIYRILGSILMLITGNRKILLFTPNFFVNYYRFFALLYFIKDYSILKNQILTIIIIAILFGINIIQEVILHVYKLHVFRFAYRNIEDRATPASLKL